MPPSVRHRPTPARPRSSQAGFTLIELLVIVAIVMILAALAGPGMMRAMAINRAQRANGQLVRVGRRARQDALTYGRAYALVYNNSGMGRFELWRGVNDSCRANPWARIVVSGSCGPGQPDCADMFDATTYGAGTATHHVQIVSPVQRLCFEPNGEMFVDNGSGTFTPAATSVRIQLDRYDLGTSSSPVEARFVSFPPLAAPRSDS